MAGVINSTAVSPFSTVELLQHPVEIFKSPLAIVGTRLCSLTVESRTVNAAVEVTVSSESDATIFLQSILTPTDSEKLVDCFNQLKKDRQADASVIGVRINRSHDGQYYTLCVESSSRSVQIKLLPPSADTLSMHLVQAIAREKSLFQNEQRRAQELETKLREKESELEALKSTCMWQSKEIGLLTLLAQSNKDGYLQHQKNQSVLSSKELCACSHSGCTGCQDSTKREARSELVTPMEEDDFVEEIEDSMAGSVEVNDRDVEELSTSNDNPTLRLLLGNANQNEITEGGEILKNIKVNQSLDEGQCSKEVVTTKSEIRNDEEQDDDPNKKSQDFLVGVAQYILCQLCPEQSQSSDIRDLKDMEDHFLKQHVDKDKCEACPSEPQADIIQHMRIHTNRNKRGRGKRTWIVNPNEVEPVENLANINELTTQNLMNFVGSTDNSAESARTALEFLARYSLIHNQRTCSACRSSMTLVSDSADRHHGIVWHCPPCKTNKSTRKIRVRDDSFFENMHLTIQKVLFLAAGWVESPGKRIVDVATEHGVSKDLVGHLHQWFRDLTQQWWEREVQSGEGKLGGPGKIVEIYETLLYSAKYNRGNSLSRPQYWIFGMIERGSNKVAMMQMQQRNAATLLPIIEKHILPGTLIISDGWAAYGDIKDLQAQYDHHWVNHKVHFVAPDDKRVHTQSIEATWGAFKRHLKSRFGDPADKIDGHMCNYMFRKAHNREKLLNHLIIEMKYYRKDMSNSTTTIPVVSTLIPWPTIYHTTLEAVESDDNIDVTK